MFKILGFVSLMIFSSNVFAKKSVKSLTCQWLSSPSHKTGFFTQDVGFRINYQSGNKAFIQDNGFFFRNYTPCWTGGHSTCAFSFDYDEESSWTVVDKESIFQSNDYGQARLHIAVIDGGLSVVTGEDGDGVFFNEKFICLKN